jgi:uncharacterized protein
VRSAACAIVLAALLAACGGGEGSSEAGEQPAPIGAADLPPPPAEGFGGPVEVRVGDAGPLAADVAQTPGQRAYGLRGRDEVPPGTGMLFLFAEPRPVRFVMSGVPVPLTGVFVRDGRVVAVEQMAPCTDGDPADCPLYGPEEPVDSVVEASPESLPGVAPGDAVEVGTAGDVSAPAR